MKKTLFLLIPILVLSGCVSSSSSHSASSSTPPVEKPRLQPYEDTLVPILDDGRYVAIWADEFKGDSLDESKWQYEVNGDGGGNNELQYYRKENVAVEDGNLVITAKQESYKGKSYTSGRINTNWKFQFTYGRIQARMKLPGGKGTWPAFWMMPHDSAYGTWPKSGEIDIVEYVGYDKNRVYSTIITEKFNHKIGTQLGSNKIIPNFEDDFHVFELIWLPGNMKFFVDDDKIFEFGYNPMLPINEKEPFYKLFPFVQPFFIIFNLAFGGDWGGVNGISNDALPAKMFVDFVRVYKFDAGYYDEDLPTKPSQLQLSTIKNTIYWQASTDDYSISRYAIYLDDQFYRYSPLNQYTFTSLVKNQTYNIRVQALDFAGNESELSSPISFTYQ